MPGVISVLLPKHVVGFVLDGLADTYKTAWHEYGVAQLVNLTAR